MDFTGDLTGLSGDQAMLLERLLDDAVQEHHAPFLPAPRAVAIQRGAGPRPLFLVHGSGGQVMFLHAIAKHMAPDQPLYGIEAGNAETDPADIIRGYLATLRSVQPEGPYRLSAYSAGCLVAFEMAARLEADGEQVEALLLIDPVEPRDGRSAAQPAGPPATPHERLRRRFEMAMLAGVTPLSSQFGPIEQANRTLAKIASSFQARPLDVRIRILHGLCGGYVSTPAALEGWARLALGGLERAAVDADHFEIVREPHAAETGRQLQAWLDALSRAAPVGA